MAVVVKGLGTDATLNGGCSVQQKEVKFTTPLVILLTHVPPENDHRNQKSMSGFFFAKDQSHEICKSFHNSENHHYLENNHFHQSV